MDPTDIFLLSSILGYLLASRLKKYLSEEEAMKRLKSAIIKKSELTAEEKPVLSKKEKSKKIYKFVLTPRGGFEIIKDKFSTETYELACEIRNIIEQLTEFLIKKELQGVAKIFFKGGRLTIGLLLAVFCNIDIDYHIFGADPNVQVIIMTTALGTTTGFFMPWFLAGITLIAPPILFSTLIGRSIFQQIKNICEALAFKTLVDEIISSNKETKKRLRVVFVEDENYILVLNMENPQTDNNLKYNFEHVYDPDKVIRDMMAQELGLVENSTDEQMTEILNKPKKRRKAKTTFFGEIVGNSYDDNNIVDAEILEKQIRIKNNQMLIHC